MSKLFLVHWDDSKIEAYADELRALDWEVEHEAMDGSMAYRRVKEWLPQVIVIDLRYLPAHGRMTGMIMKKSPTTWEIPIIFVGGTPEAMVKAKEDVFDAHFCSLQELPQILEAYKNQA